MDIVAPTAPIIDVVKSGYWLASTASILHPANIDATFFTHLFVGYAYVDSTTYKVTIDPSQDILINEFSLTVRIRNQDVKTLLSIQAGSEVFAEMAKDEANRNMFIKSSIEVARAGSYDGLDLQWLYPSSTDEMNNFGTLIGSWRNAVVQEAIDFIRPELLLVASVSNVPYLYLAQNIQYPIQAIKKNLSWVNLISYDLYTPTSSKDATGPSSAFNNPKANDLSANFGIQSWTQAKLPSNKIVFGIPFHGWAWKLTNFHQHDVFSQADGAAQGNNISVDGEIYYSNVIQFIDDNQAGVENDDKSFLIAYTYSGPTWIAYESEYSIADKISLAKSNKILGYFAFNIAADDDVNTLANAALTNW